MQRICLKCENRIPHDDEPFEPCPTCGVNEWAVIHVSALKLTLNDRRFLKAIHIACDEP